MKSELLATWMVCVSPDYGRRNKGVSNVPAGDDFHRCTAGGCAHFDEKPGCGHEESNAFVH